MYSTQLLIPNYLLYSPTDAASQFFRKLPSVYITNAILTLLYILKRTSLMLPAFKSVFKMNLRPVGVS